MTHESHVRSHVANRSANSLAAKARPKLWHHKVRPFRGCGMSEERSGSLKVWDVCPFRNTVTVSSPFRTCPKITATLVSRLADHFEQGERALAVLFLFTVLYTVPVCSWPQVEALNHSTSLRLSTRILFLGQRSNEARVKSCLANLSTVNDLSTDSRRAEITVKTS